MKLPGSNKYVNCHLKKIKTARSEWGNNLIYTGEVINLETGTHIELILNSVVIYEDPYATTRDEWENRQQNKLRDRQVGGRKAEPRKGSYEARMVKELKKLAASRHIPVTGLNKSEIIAKLRGKR